MNFRTYGWAALFAASALISIDATSAMAVPAGPAAFAQAEVAGIGVATPLVVEAHYSRYSGGYHYHVPKGWHGGYPGANWYRCGHQRFCWYGMYGGYSGRQVHFYDAYNGHDYDYPDFYQDHYVNGGDNHVQWCADRYITYNSQTDTYVGRDGRYHRCLAPRY